MRRKHLPQLALKVQILLALLLPTGWENIKVHVSQSQLTCTEIDVTHNFIPVI